MRLRAEVMACVVLLGAVAPVIAADDPGMALFAEVLAHGERCASGKTGSAVISCYERATPKKCRPYVIAVYASRDEASRYASRHAWRLCVATCSEASFWSRTFGACAREL